MSQPPGLEFQLDDLLPVQVLEGDFRLGLSVSQMQRAAGEPASGDRLQHRAFVRERYQLGEQFHRQYGGDCIRLLDQRAQYVRLFYGLGVRQSACTVSPTHARKVAQLRFGHGVARYP